MSGGGVCTVGEACGVLALNVNMKFTRNIGASQQMNTKELLEVECTVPRSRANQIVLVDYLIEHGEALLAAARRHCSKGCD